MRIAHTADIHIRGLSRHDEYKQILKFFADDCRDQKVDHIFVGGDIFHTKTSGISPEYIAFLTWWLNYMSDVAPVHLILGNHDLNLSNLSRQDAVSPIVEAIKSPNIFLYKNSGIYSLSKGFNLCVFSCVDEDTWSKIEPDPGNINIAAFHGPVKGSTTETGWDVSEGISVDYFSKFDFCLLGDIHKHQILGYRNNKPWIAYPGSAIQQNYAEDIKHGYLIWDIYSKDEWNVKFRPLPNVKPFVTINWSNNFDALIEEVSKFPKGSRFRIRTVDHVSQKELLELTSILKNNFEASEVTHKSEAPSIKPSLKSNEEELKKSDLRSSDVLLKLIKDHHKNSSISDKTWDEISSSIKNLLSVASSSDDSSRNSKWSLRHLKFDNLFSYGEDNSINFDDLSGIVGIFGPNRIGKSSVVGTIMYSLFNTTDRGPMKNIHVCNIRKPYCFSRAIINHNGADYIIERQTTKSENKKGVINAATSLNFFKMRDDGELDDLNGEQRSDTEKTIRTLFGSAEDFLLTSLSAQGEINQFISQGSSKRRAILSRVLDLDIFDKMYELASKEVSGIKYQLKNYPDKDWNSELENINNQLFNLEEAIKKNDHELTSRKIESVNLQNALLNLGELQPVTDEQVKFQENKVLNLENSCKDCSQKIDSLLNEILENTKKIQTIRDLQSEYSVEDLKGQKSEISLLESELISLKHALDKEETSLRQHQKSLSILDDIPCGDKFPSCKFIKDAYVSREKFDEQSISSMKTKKAVQEAIQRLELLKNEEISEKLEKLEKLSQLERKLDLEISKKETEVARLRLAYETNLGSLEKSKLDLDNMQKALKKIDNIETISLHSKLENLSNDIHNLETKKTSYSVAKGKLTSDKEKIEYEKLKRDELLELLKASDIISSSFSKKGIPLAITKSQLPAINEEIAKILHGIVDFTVELENDEDSDASEVYINYGDSKRIIELCSGMEKTIASLALRVAMINVSSLPKSDMFIIDEGFGTLDDSAVEACNRFLTSLKKYFKTIIVITHVDGIKDSADHILEISKIEKDAKIMHGAN